MIDEDYILYLESIVISILKENKLPNVKILDYHSNMFGSVVNTKDITKNIYDQRKKTFKL